MVLANVSSFRVFVASFRFWYPRSGFGCPGNIRQNHSFGNHPFANIRHLAANSGCQKQTSKKIYLRDLGTGCAKAFWHPKRLPPGPKKTSGIPLRSIRIHRRIGMPKKRECGLRGACRCTNTAKTVKNAKPSKPSMVWRGVLLCLFSREVACCHWGWKTRQSCQNRQTRKTQHPPP